MILYIKITLFLYMNIFSSFIYEFIRNIFRKPNDTLFEIWRFIAVSVHEVPSIEIMLFLCVKSLCQYVYNWINWTSSWYSVSLINSICRYGHIVCFNTDYNCTIYWQDTMFPTKINYYRKTWFFKPWSRIPNSSRGGGIRFWILDHSNF